MASGGLHRIAALGKLYRVSANSSHSRRTVCFAKAANCMVWARWSTLVWLRFHLLCTLNLVRHCEVNRNVRETLGTVGLALFAAWRNHDPRRNFVQHRKCQGCSSSEVDVNTVWNWPAAALDSCLGTASRDCPDNSERRSQRRARQHGWHDAGGSTYPAKWNFLTTLPSRNDASRNTNVSTCRKRL